MPSPHFLAPMLARAAAGTPHVLRRANADIASDLVLAGDSASRRQGLLGRDGLPAGAALVIAPTFAIHTFGMRFPIDVIFAARDGRVLKVVRGLSPKRVAWAPGAFAAIELAAGGAASVQPGEHLAVAPRPSPPPPA